MGHHHLAALMPHEPEIDPPPAEAEAERLYLLRLAGDFYVKSPKTRSHFFRRLLGNLRAALTQAGVASSLAPTWSRLYLRSPDPRAPEIAARVFGIQSVSEVRRVPWREMEELVRAGVELFGPLVRGRRFAVRARRRGGAQASTLPSPELERALGRALLEAGGAKVDLKNPEIEAEVDYEPGVAHLSGGRLPGPGGLPLGVEGRALVLLSGGFDSAVAAWMMLKRGVQLDYLFCNLGGAAHRLAALRVAEILAERWSCGSSPRLLEIPFGPLAAELRERVRGEHRQVILKRQMLRAGAEAARRRKALALVTGDALGQVSSQTLQNLAVTSQAVPDLPLLRPLLGFNKEEILALARRIGVYEAAALTQELCALGPERPSTRTRLAQVLEDETGLDPGGIEEALRALRSHPLRPGQRRAATALSLPGEVEEVDQLPEGAVLLDLRPVEATRADPLPGALRLDLPAALAALPHLDRAKSYAVTCEVGIKSLALAERMREAGLQVVVVRRPGPRAPE